MKKVSMQNIADRLGVSKAVVSFVLNGKGKENRISNQTIKRVLVVAKELNYKPNQISKWFRTGKTQTIGLVLADISNPFFGKLGREIEQEAYKKGYKIIICSSDENPQKSEKQLEMLKNSMVDGIIIAPPPGSSDQIKDLENDNIPYVLVDRFFPEIDSSYVIIDNYTAAYNATKFLIKKQYRNITFITVNDELITMHQRTNGYINAVENSKTSREPLVIKLPFSHQIQEVRDAISKLVSKENPIDAILFSSSKIGFMGLEVIAGLGLKIPEDIAVVSFDDPDYFKVCYSPVTAIAQPLEEMGKKAVCVLVEKIESNEENKISDKIVLKTNFIERKSS